MTDSSPASTPSMSRSAAPSNAERDTDEWLAGAIAARYAEGGAPMMHEMGLTITAAERGRVRFTLPVRERVTHAGGVLCGQAIMACMDTGMVFVMMSLDDDPDAQFTTVQLHTSFQRGVPADVGEVTFEARATKAGRTLVFGEVDLFLPDGERAAHATTTFIRL